jgi:hypothetical protein
METIITGSHPLRLAAAEARDKLALTGGNEQLLRKLDDMLKLQNWHGGHALKVQNLIEQAKAL